MEIPHQITTIGWVLGLAWATILPATEQPAPTPTPKPGTLAAFAQSRSLNRAPGPGRDNTIVITDENLDRLGQDAVVTVMTSTIADPAVIEIDQTADPKTREKWRKKVLAQGNVIAKLEARRVDAEAELNRLERGKIDGRTLDRIAKAETKIQAIDAEIRSEKAQLSTIIRAARKEGAQPGWFR